MYLGFMFCFLLWQIPDSEMWIIGLAIVYPPSLCPTCNSWLLRHWAANGRIKKRLMGKLKSSHPVVTCQLKGWQHRIAVMQNRENGGWEWEKGWIKERLNLSAGCDLQVEIMLNMNGCSEIRYCAGQKERARRWKGGRVWASHLSRSCLPWQESGPNVPLHVSIKHKRWPRAKYNDLKSWHGTLSVCVCLRACGCGCVCVCVRVFILGMLLYSNRWKLG